ncbi:MAG: hypothetical protein U0359_38590 [Byssovorax sp.]
MLRAAPFSFALTVAALAACAARADDASPLTFQAAHADADPALHTLDLRGAVRAAYGPYRLRSEHLTFTLDDDVLRFDGDGKVALCPCPDPPIAFGFRGGSVSSAGDLKLRWPRVELFGTPVFALPYLWLRSPDQIGALPPLVAYRTEGGLLLGTGLHVPLGSSEQGARSLDLMAAAYTQGGAEISASLLTPASRVRVVADELRGLRLRVDAQGSSPAGDRPGLDLAWDLDAIRGERARRGSVDLAEAAQPFDTGAASVVARAHPGASELILGAGAVGRAIRGDGGLLLGPSAGLAIGGAIGRVGSWNGSAGGAVLGNALPGAALPLGDASIHAGLGGLAGPIRLRLDGGARAAIAGDQPIEAPSIDAALGARLSAELPLARAYGGAPGEAPLVHTLAPSLAIGGALDHAQGPFFQPLALTSSRGLGLAEGGLSTALGRFAGPSIRLDLRGGAIAEATGARALLEGRLGAEGPILSGSAIALAVLGHEAHAEVLLAHLRLGPAIGPVPSIRLDLAGATGQDARAARLLASMREGVPTLAPSLLLGPGWTLGAEGSWPFGRGFRLALGGVSGVSATSAPAPLALLALGARGDYRHPCGCFALSLRAGHRLGRPGADVLLAVDLAPAAPRRALLGR